MPDTRSQAASPLHPHLVEGAHHGYQIGYLLGPSAVQTPLFDVVLGWHLLAILDAAGLTGMPARQARQVPLCQAGGRADLTHTTTKRLLGLLQRRQNGQRPGGQRLQAIR